MPIVLRMEIDATRETYKNLNKPKGIIKNGHFQTVKSEKYIKIMSEALLNPKKNIK